jgi:hypothetical protein
MAPRCGRPVRRKEQGGVAVLEDPVCGRPENHRGGCRSEAAVARALQAASGKRDRLQRQQNRLRRTRRLHGNLSVVIAAAVTRAERDAGASGWPVTRTEEAA